MFTWRRAFWKRLHWIEMDRSDPANKTLYSARGNLQKACAAARLKMKEGIYALPADERKVFRCEFGLWRRPRKVTTWIPMEAQAQLSLVQQLEVLGRREPARIY
ncbi:hypothetical protein PHYPSEUDO_002290 [Phytophthora pseudosyringae]|uniref:Uncharacterized protein n=1 Tax=Phytophthora pseudosyringae TaxID=221518 RepID=A0A8T1WFB0_9STRA|nr:hypothetical protein PHYPSEUDO_002290 [Phytophthora pseudosyringae]